MIPLMCDTEDRRVLGDKVYVWRGLPGTGGGGRRVILLWAELPLGMMTNAADGCTTQ